MATHVQESVRTNDSSNIAFPFRIISTISSTILVIHYSFFITKPNNEDPDLLSIVIDSSSTSSSAGIQDQNNSHHHQVVHSIIKAFQEQDMGRHLLVLTVPMLSAFISHYSQDPTSSLVVSLIMLLLSFGFAATWNGILLREMYPRASNATQLIGVTLIFLAFFGLVASLLPPKLAWIPLLCFGLCLLPFILALCLTTKSTHPQT